MVPIYAFSTLIFAVLSVPNGNVASHLPLVAQNAHPLVGLGQLPTAVAHPLYFSILSNLKSFETATLSLLEPVGATILGIASFQEVPAPIFAFGAGLVLAGIFFIVKQSR
jgi:drug/metabolite transporter (DMT)-like permease